MATHDSFLAMILTNAKREEASSLALGLELTQAMIEMELPDGSVRHLSAPPQEIMLRIIESLKQGCRVFESSVFLVTIENLEFRQSDVGDAVQITQWTIEHR